MGVAPQIWSGLLPVTREWTEQENAEIIKRVRMTADHGAEGKGSVPSTDTPTAKTTGGQSGQNVGRT